MDFLNKHYEKLILLTVLIIFFIGMIFVLNTLDKTREVKDTDLRIPPRTADFKGSAKDEKKVSEQWTAGRFNWAKGEVRKAFSVQVCYSDLVQFVPLAICPGSKEKSCGKMIPRSFFAKLNCPECGTLLEAPAAASKIRRNVITADDSDGDGMPDVYESKHGLNLNDPLDAQYDKDGDGFSNYFEMVSNTDPGISYNRPPLWTRLRLVAVDRVVLPISFRALNDNNSDDPKNWDVQFNVMVLNRRTEKMVPRSRTLRIGEDIKIDNHDYRLVKVDRRKRAKTKEELAQEKESVAENTSGSVRINKSVSKDDKFVDESIAYFEEMLAPDAKYEKQTLEMQVGKKAYSKDTRPIFADDGLLPEERDLDENRFALKLGQEFSLGNRRITGVERYKLVSFDNKTKTAVLHRSRTRPKEKKEVDVRGNAMVVTSEGSIPEDSRIIKPVEKKLDNDIQNGEI